MSARRSCVCAHNKDSWCPWNAPRPTCSSCPPQPDEADMKDGMQRRPFLVLLLVVLLLLHGRDHHCRRRQTLCLINCAHWQKAFLSYVYGQSLFFYFPSPQRSFNQGERSPWRRRPQQLQLLAKYWLFSCLLMWEQEEPPPGPSCVGIRKKNPVTLGRKTLMTLFCQEKDDILQDVA